MKVAIVSDSIVEFGGSERVLLELINLFPQTKVFTNYYKGKIIKKHFPSLNKNNFKASWFQFFPKRTTTTAQFFSPLIWRFNELKNYDLIITNSLYDLSPIATIGLKPMVHYVYTLPKNLFGLEKQTFWQNNLPFSCQKNLYLKSLKNSLGVVTISKHIQNTLKTLTGINSSVIYPPVSIPKVLPKLHKSNYFLIISRIDPAKGIEIAVNACKYLRVPLKIAGEARDANYLSSLKKLAGNNIEFLGFVSEKEKEILYKRAIAFLFCSKNEDFGIAPVEAMAHGVPVIAYFGGGAKETTLNRKTGLFFYEHSWQSLESAIKKFYSIKFKPENLFEQANKFSQKRFRKEFFAYLENINLNR